MNATIPVEVKPAPPSWGDLRELAEMAGPCVTLYLGGHKAGSGSRPMRVRLPALLTKAGEMLEQKGVAPTDRERLLEPLRALAADAGMAAGHADSLAVFRSSRVLRSFWLPWPVEDEAVVEARPCLRPLVPLLHPRRHFFLLALARQNTRLLECGPGFARVVPPPEGMPTSIEAFEGFDGPENSTGTSPAGQSAGGSKGIRFGTSSFRDKQHHYLHDFCRAIDVKLKPVLTGRGWPLVLAGAPAELGAYRSANQWPGLVEEAVETSPDGGWTDVELGQHAREVIGRWQSAEERQALHHYERAGREKRVQEMGAILEAAAAGRVQHLFLTSQAPQPGDVDRLTNRALLSGDFVGRGDDLANAALVETLRHGGEVWSVAPPDGAADCALLRF